MRDQTITLEFQKLGILITDTRKLLGILGSQLDNLRARQVIVQHALEASGVLTTEMIKGSIEALKKATDETVPPDPAESPESKETKDAPPSGTP